MLYPALPDPAPRLAAVPVAALLTHFAAALPWLDNAYGLVQTGVDKSRLQRYPQLYRNDGSRQVTDLRMDERMQALSWFEYDGPSLYEPDESVGGTSGYFRHQLAVVLWLNLDRLAPGRADDCADEVVEDFFVRGLLASPLGGELRPERIERDPARVFERYRWEPATHQLLMHPYAACRIPFEVLSPFSGCVAPFEIVTV